MIRKLLKVVREESIFRLFMVSPKLEFLELKSPMMIEMVGSGEMKKLCGKTKVDADGGDGFVRRLNGMVLSKSAKGFDAELGLVNSGSRGCLYLILS